ncbi:MAG: ATPase [Candidatus Diapherotrites archaeon]|nr:ATPase [Candidatus Diapherotrites archaeon]
MVLLDPVSAKALAASIAIAGGALATAWVQAAVGSSAIGVIAEKPEESSKLLVWMALPETLVIFSFVIAILLTLNFSL